MVEKIDMNRMNELAEFIVLDYLKKQGIDSDTIICVDIEGIARDYFGLDVLFENIAEDDLGKTGFCANGQKPLTVIRNGKKQQVVFPDNTVVLDRFYQKKENYASRRFVLGHEVGHKILGRVAPEHSRGNYNTIFDKERVYFFDDLLNMYHIGESQANQMSAALLMPVFLLKRTLRRVMRSERFPVYGDYQMLPQDSQKLKQMADDLGVSTSSLFIRLRNCKLIAQKDIQEYADLILKQGGNAVVCDN